LECKGCSTIACRAKWKKCVAQMNLSSRFESALSLRCQKHLNYSAWTLLSTGTNLVFFTPRALLIVLHETISDNAYVPTDKPFFKIADYKLT
jgi:hypothetical protein